MSNVDEFKVGDRFNLCESLGTASPVYEKVLPKGKQFLSLGGLTIERSLFIGDDPTNKHYILVSSDDMSKHDKECKIIGVFTITSLKDKYYNQ